MTCGGAAGLRPLRPSPLSWHWHSHGYLHSSRDNKSPESERRRASATLLRGSPQAVGTPTRRGGLAVSHQGGVLVWGVPLASVYCSCNTISASEDGKPQVEVEQSHHRRRLFFFYLFFFSQTCSRLFLFWCVRTPQRTTQARSEVKFEAKKTKQNVPHYAKLECRSRTEKVLSYVKFTLEGEKKTQGNQRSHILYNPSLRFSHRCEGKC